MKAIFLAAVFAFCSVITFTTAKPQYIPSELASKQQLYIPSEVARAQWHLRAPALGCVELAHSLGGSTFRVYACDGLNG